MLNTNRRPVALLQHRRDRQRIRRGNNRRKQPCKDPRPPPTVEPQHKQDQRRQNNRRQNDHHNCQHQTRHKILLEQIKVDPDRLFDNQRRKKRIQKQIWRLNVQPQRDGVPWQTSGTAARERSAWACAKSPATTLPRESNASFIVLTIPTDLQQVDEVVQRRQQTPRDEHPHRRQLAKQKTARQQRQRGK